MSSHRALEYVEEVVMIEYNEHEDLDYLFFRQDVRCFETRLFEGCVLKLDGRIRLPVQDVQKGCGEPVNGGFLIIAHERAAMLYRFPE